MGRDCSLVAYGCDPCFSARLERATHARACLSYFVLCIALLLVTFTPIFPSQSSHSFSLNLSAVFFHALFAFAPMFLACLLFI